MDHAEELLRRIHRDGIRPVPRWAVFLRRAGRIVLLAAVVCLVALSSALVLQEFRFRSGPGWLFRAVFAELAPWIWSATAVLATWGAWQVFRELPRAWRLRPLPVVALIALSGAGLGAVLERSDALLALHRALAHAVPAYRSVWQRQALRAWQDPAAGRLAGLVADVTFVDVEGKSWFLTWADSSDLAPCGLVRLRGRVLGADGFLVTGWRPAPGSGGGWGGGRGRHGEEP